MARNIQIYKNNINSKLKNLNFRINKIYGGITEHNTDIRMSQHIRDGQPHGCNNKWKCEKVTKYTLTKNTESDKRKISAIENYLINSLDEKFNDRCVNGRDEYGVISQFGGNGLNIENNNPGDEIIFYIFYELSNTVISFI